MKVVTIQEQLDSVATRYKNYYYYADGDVWRHNDSEATYNRLAALPVPVQPADALRALNGNSGWFEVVCHECGAELQRAIEVGEYSDSFIKLCADCLRKALAAIDPVFRDREQHQIEADLNAEFE